MKFGFVAKHRGTKPVRTISDMLGVSRSGFYAWYTRPESVRSRTDAGISTAMRASFQLSDRNYGARRILRDLRAAGVRIGLHHVERLMQLHALRARPRRRALPTDTGDRLVHAIAANLLDRDFTATAPTQKWVADFTYLWTTEGWLYVAVVLDLFSRRVIGWSMQSTMTAQLVTDALLMAVWRRGTPPTDLAHSSRTPGRIVSTRADGAGHRLQHESVRRRLGQRRDGELLLDPRNGAYRPEALPGPRCGTRGCLRLSRAGIQSDPEAFHTGLCQPGRIRARCSLAACPRHRGQLSLRDLQLATATAVHNVRCRGWARPTNEPATGGGRLPQDQYNTLETAPAKTLWGQSSDNSRSQQLGIRCASITAGPRPPESRSRGLRRLPRTHT